MLDILGIDESDIYPLSSNNAFFVHTDWILDTGTSMHMTGSIQHLTNSAAINGASPVFIPNRHSIRAAKIGNKYIGGRFLLNDVLYVPDFKCNLISVA